MSDFFDESNPEIYEPLKMYKGVYKALHTKNATELFDELTLKSGIDINANRETIGKLKEAIANRDEKKAKISRSNRIIALFIFLCIVGIILFAITLLSMINDQEVSWILALTIFGVAIVPISIVVVTKQSKVVVALKDEEAKLSSTISSLNSQAWKELNPLNKLFSQKMPRELFRKTLPIINLDSMFDMRRYDYLVSRFGLLEVNDPDHSTLFVQSGDIVGNPFYIANDLIHEMGTKDYTGYKVITWTTTVRVKGQTITQHHSQTLSATVTKPFPYYKEKAYVLYANDAAPNLIFARRDSDAENLSQAQIDKFVERQIKKLKKQSEKSTLAGKSFTVSGNSEFEVLFGATNRNNEVEYRLLFTPLAQKQLLELMKEKIIGFGDNFDFIKHKKLNYLYPQHLNNFALQVSDAYFYGYDYDEVKEKFISYNQSYFRHLYFALAPILAIPLYQQQKPREYIYKDLYDSYLSFYEHEAIANKLNSKEFIHPLSKTRNILKTSVVKSGENYDNIKIEAKGYRAENRVDYVTKLGGDGKFHRIRVDWSEYLPVSKETTVSIAYDDKAGEEKTYADIFKDALGDFKKDGTIDKERIFEISSFIVYRLNM